MNRQPNHDRREQRPRRPDPSEPFYLERYLEYLNAGPPPFVDRSQSEQDRERVYLKDAYRWSRTHYREGDRGEVDERAHVAYLAFLWGDQEAVNDFLGWLFDSWPRLREADRLPEDYTSHLEAPPSRSGLREALFKELERAYSRPANVALKQPYPWQDPENPKAKGNLATAVRKEAVRRRNEREEEARMWGKLGQKRGPILDRDIESLDTEEDAGDTAEEKIQWLAQKIKVRVLEKLTQDRHPMTRALAREALERWPEEAKRRDLMSATGATGSHYKEFQRKLKLELKKALKKYDQK